jgi:hypothetical protein
VDGICRPLMTSGQCRQHNIPRYAIDINAARAFGAHNLPLVRISLASSGAGATGSEEAKRKEFLKADAALRLCQAGLLTSFSP